MSSALTSGDVRGRLEHLAAELARVIASARSRYSTTAWSRSVVVGELRITVSDMIAAISMIATGGEGSRPFWRKRSTTSVEVEPTGSNVARTGTRVSIEPM